MEQDLTDEELVAFVDEEPADSDSDSDINDEFVEETIKAPSLRDARQQLKAWQCFWLTTLSSQLKMKCSCKCWQSKCQDDSL